MKVFGAILLAVGAVVGLFLYSQEPDSVRAERAYEQALGFVATGDVPRASVAFRSVFKYQPNNLSARADYARLMLDNGNLIEASGQYLRLLEQDPANLDARLTLAEVQITAGSWEDAREQVSRAAAQAPDDFRVQAFVVVMAYYDAVINQKPTERFVALAQAQQIRPETPDLRPLLNVIVDGLIRAGELEAALTEVDDLIAGSPEELSLHLTRLGILDEMGRTEAVADSLQNIVLLFPDNTEAQTTLVRWYLANDKDGAERTLRAWADTGDEMAGTVLIGLLAESYGPDVAQQEIDRLIAAGANPNTFSAMRAALDFDAGRVDTAITAMQTLVANELEPDARHGYQTTLAVMLDNAGRRNQAEVVLDAVVSENPQHFEANVLRAQWLLDRGQTQEAILILRAAIDRRPDDVAVVRLLARAHQQRDEVELEGRMLALAVETSEYAPDDAVAYAAFLQADDRLGAAISVLEETIRRAPDNLLVLTGLGDLYVRTQDWNRAAQIEGQMRSNGHADAVAAADALRTKNLIEQGRSDEALALLEDSSLSASDGPAAYVSVIRTQLLSGNISRAQSVAQSAVAQHTENTQLSVVLAILSRMLGNHQEAELLYRDLLEREPESEFLWLNLVETLRDLKDGDAALAAARAGSEQVPQSLHLKWLNGVLLAESGKIEDAIDAYSEIQEINSAIPTVVNNLADLLVTYRTDAESLAMAVQLAEGLRQRPQPEFRETYGWVAFKNGDLDTALEWQIPAADELIGNALAQFRAGQILGAAGQFDLARARLSAALEATQPDDISLREQVSAQLSRLDDLEASAVLQ